MVPEPQNQDSPKESERDLQLSLSSALRDARKLSEGLDPLVGNYELKSSEFLFGLIGSLVFLLASIVLRPRIVSTLGLPALPVIVAASLLLGIALGIFLFRGPSRWRMERNLRKLTLQLKAFRDEIEILDEIDAIPPEVKSELWQAYEDAIASYRQIEKSSYRASNYPLLLFSDRKK